MRIPLFNRRKLNPEEMLPPRELREFVGGDANFLEIGNGFLAGMKQFCDLQPDARILDLGCGSGRIAIPLTQYLSKHGRYEGFDVSPACIQHCRSKIARSYPNFRFQVADIYNSFYNPTGRRQAEEYRFPYEAEQFDVAVAGSLFTHLMPASAERYIAETARVLKPGGRALSTFFLLDAGAREALAAGKSSIPFVAHNGCLVSDPAVPEVAVCFDLDFILSLYDKYGFAARDGVFFGLWSGRQTEYGGYQDMIVARKIG